MNSLNTRLRLLAAAAVVTISLAASPVAMAEHGSSDGNSGNAGSQQNRSPEKRGESGNTSSRQQSEQKDTSDDSTSLRSRTDKLLNEKRANHTQRTQAERQKICENRKAAITKKLNDITTRAQRHLTAYNSTFAKVQAYQTKNQLAVHNYAELVTAAATKQGAATAAVATLKTASVAVDCTAADPAARLATSKTATDDARSTLQTYRSSLKDLINALLAAKPAKASTENTTEDN